MENKDDSAEATERCISCGAKLKGEYCRKCGERKVIPERDFRIHKFLNQTVWHFVHFDSKLFKSIWFLFSKPGFLSSEWIIGRRVGYMKPLQLFVLASILFYFFLPTTTAYFAGARDLAAGYQNSNYAMNTFQFDYLSVLTDKATSLHITNAELEAQIMAKSAVHSKTGLFLLIPFWGALIFLLFRRKYPWPVPHLTFAMHALTFYIFFDLLLHAVIWILGIKVMGRDIFLILMISFPVYQALAVRRVFQSSWTETIAKTSIMALAFFLILILYKQIVTICTVYFWPAT